MDMECQHVNHVELVIIHHLLMMLLVHQFALNVMLVMGYILTHTHIAHHSTTRYRETQHTHIHTHTCRVE
jgi:hypothetical protein